MKLKYVNTVSAPPCALYQP